LHHHIGKENQSGDDKQFPKETRLANTEKCYMKKSPFIGLFITEKDTSFFATDMLMNGLSGEVLRAKPPSHIKTLTFDPALLLCLLGMKKQNTGLRLVLFSGPCHVVLKDMR